MSDTPKLSWSTRKQLYERASSQLKNDLSLPEILHNYRMSLQRRGRNKAADGIHHVWRRVRNGDTFARALSSSLTDLERGILAASEPSGKLPLGMGLILEIRERVGQLKWKMVMSLLPPLTYFLSTYFMLFIVGAMALPPFLEMVPAEKWTGWAYVLYLMGAFATSWVGPVAMFVVACFVALGIWALPRWTGLNGIPGRVFFDRWIPGFSEYRELIGFAWLMAYSSLLHSGKSEADALMDQIRSSNPWLASRLRPILQGVKNGLRIDEAMRRSGMGFPSLDLIDEIGAYAGKPGFSERIEAVSRSYLARLERHLMIKTGITTAIFTIVMFFILFVYQQGSNALSAMMTMSIH